jgi:hypothetical protein
MTVNFTKGKFNLREKLKELERPSVDKLVTKDENGAYIDTIRGTTKLESIDSVISDTAVDIFIYDTSKDSDGGAWRHRTTHTSWYNEELNTATRGSRREFPAVAVIVAEGTKLTIYDGDDPDLPMWMVFNVSGQIGSSSNMLPRGGGSQLSDITSVAFLNSKLVVGLKDVDGTVGEGPIEVNFISDFSRVYREVGSGYTGAIYNLPISGRNSNGTYSGDYNTLGIIAQTINDVAMTVLPNAPIDDATGLPIPTIAVATNSGVSVIKDDGTVVDLTGYIHNSVDFYGEILAITFEGYSDVYFGTIPTSDVSAVSWTSRVYSSGTLQTILLNDNLDKTVKQKSEKSAAIGSNAALLLIDEDVNTPSKSMLAFIESNYNTGWMHGDIKGAFLSDTDATNVSASTNLVTNGTFDSDNSSWDGTGISQLHNSFTTSQSSGYLIVNSNTNSSSYYGISQDVTTATGTEYMLSFDVVSGGTGDGAVRVADGNTATNLLPTVSGLGVGSYSFRFVSGSQSFSKVFLGRDALTNSGTNRTVYYDNIVVREITEEDRSVNDKGLAVYGTITKSAVATGAELVAYSFGGNDANYLEQPYNSDLDFGTGDFYYSIWFKTDSSDTYSGSYDYLFERSSIGDPSTRRIEARITSATSVDVFAFGSGFTSSSSGMSVGANVWNKLDILRSSGTAYVYINGELRTSGSNNGNATDTAATLVVGSRAYFNPRNSTLPANAKISLFKVSASAPSAEQIKKIYEDEKFLFQENAACTLYGSSDAVTALAYDEVTERLHVGTSGGRSEFQGLRRINNTTTAVTTAISAYDSFVVEQ